METERYIYLVMEYASKGEIFGMSDFDFIDLLIEFTVLGYKSRQKKLRFHQLSN